MNDEPTTVANLHEDEANTVDEPLPPRDEIIAASQPGERLLEPVLTADERRHLYQEALVHLVAGKNVIFYGPPGSGKTRIAKRLGHVLCSDLHIETAHAEWTHQEVVGGYRPAGENFESQPGLLTTAAAGCESSLEEHGHPQWLVIDELNRANLDEAFGDVFTLLDVSHRNDTSLTYGDDVEQTVPLAFRILGTMNTEDQAQLFTLGYAFRRRFAFVEVPPLYGSDRDVSTPAVDIDDVELTTWCERAGVIIEHAAIEEFDQLDTDTDSVLGIPVLESVFEPNRLYEEVLDTVRPPESDLTFDRAILAFIQRLSQEDVADIGQGVVIDTYKFLISHYALFPDETDWETVDRAVVSYILPQLENYTSELRRAETVAADSGAIDAFDSVIQRAQELGFARTVAQLEQARTDHEIIG